MHHHGLVEPLVWNRRTGNLVSGHQRIGILDADAKKRGLTEYLLTVSIVDVDLTEEKKLNVALNNVAAQGGFELESLESLLREIGADELDDTGFDVAELATIFDGSAAFTLPGEAEADAAAAPIVEQLQQVRATQKAKRAARQDRLATEQDPEFYLVLVFGNRAECEAFARAAGESPDMRHLNGRAIATRLGIPLQPDPAPPHP